MLLHCGFPSAEAPGPGWLSLEFKRQGSATSYSVTGPSNTVLLFKTRFRAIPERHVIHSCMSLQSVRQDRGLESAKMKGHVSTPRICSVNDTPSQWQSHSKSNRDQDSDSVNDKPFKINQSVNEPVTANYQNSDSWMWLIFIDLTGTKMHRG